MVGRIAGMRNVVCAVLLLTMLMLVGCASQITSRVNADSGRGFMTRRLPNGREYAVFVPLHYDAHKKYPTILFLHGLGEGGSDPSKPLTVGIGPYIANHIDTFDFIVVFPQSDNGGWEGDAVSGHDAIMALEETARVYNVDRDCVTLTGLSTGGHGTWSIGARYSEHFSALAPMCAATPYTENSDRLAKQNIWAFENAGDPFVTPFSTQISVGAVRSAGGTVKHTVYPLPGHDCWGLAYGEELFDWMKANRRAGSVRGDSRAVVSAMSVPPTPAPKRAEAEPKMITPAPRVAAPVAPLPAVRANVPAQVDAAPARGPSHDAPSPIIPPTVW